MKMRVQAQHLQIGDVVGSGEVIRQVIVYGVGWPSSKVKIILGEVENANRASYWGKYTLINVERAEK